LEHLELVKQRRRGQGMVRMSSRGDQQYLLMSVQEVHGLRGQESADRPGELAGPTAKTLCL